jgi:hypothetical protein
MSAQAAARPSFFNRLYRALILPGLALSFATGYISLTGPLQPDAEAFSYPLWVRVAGAVVVGPISIVLGWFVARRMPHSLIGPVLILWGCATNAELGVGHLPAVWGALTLYYLGVVTLPGVVLMLAFFPTGWGVTPRWHRLMQAVTLASMAIGFLGGLGQPLAYGLTSPNPLSLAPLIPMPDLSGFGFVTLLAAMLLAVGQMIYRYRITHAAERKQMRWLLVVGWYLAVFAVVTFNLDFSGGLGALENLIFSVMALLVLALPSVTISFAILFHRLWDIDVLIRRTLTYSVLSAVLALAYFGSVVALQSLLRGVIGGESQVAIVLSTLLIAALFVPLRARVQRAIDRRFYRKKYDAARTLAAFAAGARDETDLERLNERLVTVVDETMQPASISLWLKDNRPA